MNFARLLSTTGKEPAMMREIAALLALSFVAYAISTAPALPQQLPERENYSTQIGSHRTQIGYSRQLNRRVSGKRYRVTPGIVADYRPAGNAWIATARQYIGTNPTSMARLWCGNFMRLVSRQATGQDFRDGNLARNWARVGTPASGPAVGVIAIYSRGKTGGHVGIITGFDARGRPILLSGNSAGRRVAEHAYPRRAIAYRWPPT